PPGTRALALGRPGGGDHLVDVGAREEVVDEGVRNAGHGTMIASGARRRVLAPTPALPRKRGRELKAAASAPSPACGGGLGWGPTPTRTQPETPESPPGAVEPASRARSSITAVISAPTKNTIAA